MRYQGRNKIPLVGCPMAEFDRSTACDLEALVCKTHGKFENAPVQTSTDSMLSN